jgi:hypothetical protein
MHVMCTRSASASSWIKQLGVLANNGMDIYGFAVCAASAMTELIQGSIGERQFRTWEMPEEFGYVTG